MSWHLPKWGVHRQQATATCHRRAEAERSRPPAPDEQVSVEVPAAAENAIGSPREPAVADRPGS